MDILGSKIYIFGAGHLGRRLCGQLNPFMKIAGFLDNNDALWYKKIDGRTVFPADDILRCGNLDGKIVIAVQSLSIISIIKAQLEAYGGVYGKDFFSYQDIYDVIYGTTGKLLLRHTEIYVTSRCTLQCKACSLLLPHIAQKKDRNVQEIIRDMDLYFSVVDSVGSFNFVGGEALLHNSLREFISYYGEKYRKFSQTSYIVTNGTHVPSVDCLKILRKYNISVEISYYDHPLAHKNRDLLIEALENAGIAYKARHLSYWTDIYGNPYEEKQYNEERLKALFLQCNPPCRHLCEGRYWYCSTNSGAYKAGVVSLAEEDFIDLSKKENLKERLLQFERGKISRGFVSFCKNCYGYPETNKRHIPIAEQL